MNSNFRQAFCLISHDIIQKSNLSIKYLSNYKINLLSKIMFLKFEPENAPKKPCSKTVPKNKIVLYVLICIQYLKYTVYTDNSFQFIFQLCFKDVQNLNENNLRLEN